MERLEQAFLDCEKLQQHMRFLLAKGSLYKVYNNNLLYHGCVPLNEDGELESGRRCIGKKYKGKAAVRCTGQLCEKRLFCIE